MVFDLGNVGFIQTSAFHNFADLHVKRLISVNYHYDCYKHKLQHILLYNSDVLKKLINTLTSMQCRGLLPDPNPRVPKYCRVSGRVSG